MRERKVTPSSFSALAEENRFRRPSRMVRTPLTVMGVSPPRIRAMVWDTHARVRITG